MKVALFFIMAAGGIAASLSMPASGRFQNFTALSSEIVIPAGYRDWKLISVAHEAGDLNDIRAILGNDVAVQTYRDDTLPFPEGTIIARVAWKYTASAENNKVFGQEQSFVAGAPTNVQFMIKDSSKYATNGGWGFAQFTSGRPGNQAVASECFSCHQHEKVHDFVFTRYAP